SFGLSGTGGAAACKQGCHHQASQKQCNKLFHNPFSFSCTMYYKKTTTSFRSRFFIQSTAPATGQTQSAVYQQRKWTLPASRQCPNRGEFAQRNKPLHSSGKRFRS